MLRGEGVRARLTPGGCPSIPGRVEAGMGPFIQNLLRSFSSQRVQQPLFAVVYFAI